MSVVVEVTVPADAFALAQTLGRHPAQTVEAERVASHSPEWALPFLWVSGDDFEAFTETLCGDPTVEDASLVEESGGERLYKVLWDEAVLDLITEMIDRHATILEAEGNGGRWRLKLRFADGERLSSFRAYFAEVGRSFTVERLYHPTSPRQREYRLTPQQREALVMAARGGYFDIPRQQSIAELAEALGISSNAASQRLRRGSRNLVRNTLTIGTPDED